MKSYILELNYLYSIILISESEFKPIKPGIRAQLLNKKTNELVEDFIIEHTKNSTHILNAVSPAFTCSFSLAKHIVKEVLKNKKLYEICKS